MGDGELPGKLRHLREQWHSLQPRISPARRNLRHAQNYTAAAKIKAGLQDRLYMGNLDAKRDWGYAKEYVEAMWLMLQQDEPGDYVIATGETDAVHEFLGEAFSYLGLDWHELVDMTPSIIARLRWIY